MTVAQEIDTTFQTVDGLTLGGTLVLAQDATDIVVMFPGGGGVDRTEHGFFTAVADSLAKVGISSLRSEHRSYLATLAGANGPPVTLSGLACDVIAACRVASVYAQRLHVLGSSLTAGASLHAVVARRMEIPITSAVLLYPVLDYWEQLVVLNGLGNEDCLTSSAAERISAGTYLRHREYLDLYREMIAELFLWDARGLLERADFPALVLHGRDDPVIPYETTERLCRDLDHVTLVELVADTHGFGKAPLKTPAGEALAASIEVELLRWMRGHNS